MAGITLVGLGSGGPDQITLEADEFLRAASELWVTTPQHPVLAVLPSTVTVRILGTEQGRLASADHDVDPETLAQVIRLCQRPEGVVLALPGHPIITSPLGLAIWTAATEIGIAPRLIAGPSPVDAVVSTLASSAHFRVFVCSAGSLAKAHVPPFPPDSHALITGVGTSAARDLVSATLRAVYPLHHEVEFLGATTAAGRRALPLGELGDAEVNAGETCLYVPPLGAGASLESLQEVIAHLRAPEGCPWDREQTHASLRPHLLEESFEAMAAMDSGDAPALREELGDLLLQIMLNAQIATESGDFTLSDVTKGIHDKLIRRHPHVFGELELDNVDGVLSNWERLKEAERAQKGESSGLLEGVPAALPALSQAQEYQDRAARVGFDWPHITGVLEKLAEEVQEVKSANDVQTLEAELGDLLFSLVNLSRWKGVDSESALRSANRRFRDRFRFIEAAAQRQGRRLSELSLEEMDALWNQAKSAERSKR